MRVRSRVDQMKPMLLVLMFTASGGLLYGQQLKGNVRLLRELDDIELKGRWYYEDLEGAREEARRTGKPLFVLLRCPP